MRLLLLLSALLSALTGAQASARAPEPAVTVGRVAAATPATQAQAALIAGRPAAAMPRPDSIVASALPMALRLGSPVPLYLSRRRE